MKQLNFTERHFKQIFAIALKEEKESSKEYNKTKCLFEDFLKKNYECL